MTMLLDAALLLALAPAEAPAAAAPADPAAEAAPVGATGTESASTSSLARALFERGLREYEAGDYADATAHWSSSYELMALDPALVKPRRVLAFDLGQAHMRAYDVDGDRSRLGKARPLLEDYVAWVDRPAHTMSDDEREDRGRAMEMLARIDILEGAPPPPTAAVAPLRGDDREVVYVQPERRGTGLIVGGSISLAAGVGFAAMAGYFAAQGRRATRNHDEAMIGLLQNPNDQALINQRDKALFEGKQANAGVISGSILSAMFGIGGVAMIVVGARKRHRAKNVALAPTFAPTFAGATLRARF